MADMGHFGMKRLAIGLLPPLVTESVQGLRRWLNPPVAALEYSPLGWDEMLIADASPGWNSAGMVEATRAKNAESYRLLQRGGPFGIGHQHNLHVSFVYVFALGSASQNIPVDLGLGWWSSLLLPRCEKGISRSFD